MLNREGLLELKKHLPDKTGEEGRVYFFGTPDDPQVLKEWYQTHWHGQIERTTGKKIPISPFHHKTKYYEMSLIYELFPEHTIGVTGAADPRLDSAADGAGYPVTVMKRVSGDPTQQAEYDAIIDKAYETLLDQTQTIEQKKRATQKADRAVVKHFGSDLRDTVRETSARATDQSPAATIDRALKLAREINPDSVVVQMLEHGIAPVRPQFNFIPGQASHGTFIEVEIIDRDRLRKKLNDRQNHEVLQRRFTRYDIFRQLDLAYTLLFCNCPQSLIDDPAVQQAAYEALITTKHYLETTPADRINFEPYRIFAGIGLSYIHDRTLLLKALAPAAIEQKLRS
ncbi:MAG: hypothetical protein WCV88_02605 [Patescibacteria group bacterium]|jgi:hypothetical protein